MDDVYQYIAQLDFTGLKSIVTAPSLPSERAIESIHADFSELHYKRWLFLRRKYEGEQLPPTRDIDILWHAHILDTLFYHEVCDYVFGYYFHHYPYFGTRGDADAQNLQESFRHMLRTYKKEFGVALPEFIL
ncbi:glycine-rich domain-containing protein [Nocardia brasiliensis]|uniref:glycine-rich domain-containing protein n=1 Tax=Nocardia brasiliensis TaxID=37326 RepID=UPI0018930C63|nr:glycine-rich domain-containing protein-like [Nocardia brasiliensis]MBF6546638.1 glycine-rich domain-containing protein-like [Nocardia brasiliensis]